MGSPNIIENMLGIRVLVPLWYMIIGVVGGFYWVAVKELEIKYYTEKPY